MMKKRISKAKDTLRDTSKDTLKLLSKIGSRRMGYWVVYKGSKNVM